MEKKWIVWSSEIEIEKYRDYLVDCGVDPDEDTDEAYERIAALLAQYLDDERDNLRGHYTGGEIIMVGTIGTWRGRFDAARLVSADGCLHRILDTYNYDEAEFYADEKDVKAVFRHHDGTNYMTFRVIPSSASDNVRGKVLSLPIDVDYIMKHTRSLRPYLAHIYGWPGRKESWWVDKRVNV